MLSRSTPIPEQSFRTLHPGRVEQASEIRRLLERARASAAPLHRGLSGDIDRERALIVAIEADRMLLDAANFTQWVDDQVFLNVVIDGRAYFFVCRRVAPFRRGRLLVSIPDTLYLSERRDRARRQPNRAEGDPAEVLLEFVDERPKRGVVTDISPGGLGVRLQVDRWTRAGAADAPVRLTFLDGREAGTAAPMSLCSAVPADDMAEGGARQGWLRVGLCRRTATGEIDVEERERILPEGVADRRSEPPLPEPRGVADLIVRRFENRIGEEIVGLLDAWGDAVDRGAPVTAIVIPSAWGQTKEALLPLARTLVETFRAEGLPVRVLRYDGIRRRGESYNDPECRVPGREHDHYVFSQGVDDIASVVDHLRGAPDIAAERVVLVSFSAAAIEARRAVALDAGRGIDGWISVVGSPDLQSMTRSISGGVDYAAGHERGIEFGRQELLGVRVDIDRIARDSFAHGMTFLEESRRDFGRIEIPVTWLHGRYDAWVDLERVRDVMSEGSTLRRHLVVLPIGHQLRWSREASETFQLVAREAVRMATGRTVAPVAAAERDVRLRRVLEQRRNPVPQVDLHAFWRDYLVGRDGSLGIELLTASSAYRALMATQIAALEPCSGERIADLGAGSAAFALQLSQSDPRADGVRRAGTSEGIVPSAVTVTGFDFVRDALSRGRERLYEIAAHADPMVYLPVEADLDLIHRGQSIPARSESFDGAIASLLISYLERPDLLLREVWRVLRPGGRLVVSSLRRDADISRIYRESFAEYEVGALSRRLGRDAEADLSAIGRIFLNDAARILDLEEEGAFQFFDPPELAELVEKCGFEVLAREAALGDPPQAVVVSARRL